MADLTFLAKKKAKFGKMTLVFFFFFNYNSEILCKFAGTITLTKLGNKEMDEEELLYKEMNPEDEWYMGPESGHHARCKDYTETYIMTKNDAAIENV